MEIAVQTRNVNGYAYVLIVWPTALELTSAALRTLVTDTSFLGFALAVFVVATFHTATFTNAVAPFGTIFITSADALVVLCATFGWTDFALALLCFCFALLLLCFALVFFTLLCFTLH